MEPKKKNLQTVYSINKWLKEKYIWLKLTMPFQIDA